MLSILIPVYNFNIVSLVTELHYQAIVAAIPFEIIILDDCSSELLRDQNKDVSQLRGVRFLEMNENIGRSRIRNRLAILAGYNSLLFMDCDSKIPDSNYIRRYIPYLGREMVVCGGRAYHFSPPEEPEHILRWLYGIRREQISALERNRDPYRSFMTNNFLVSRNILSEIQFDESILQYGHEDTLFGFELKKRNIPVVHIQNPLLHIGLEISREFLKKTREGIENLFMLIRDEKIDRTEFRDIRLLKTYDQLEKWKLLGLFRFIYNYQERMIVRNLQGPNPSLRAFDLFKLSLIDRLFKGKATGKGKVWVTS